jgi:hypothetical protein
MFWTIVSASIVTAMVSLVCIVGIPYVIAPTPWGARILTGIRTPFAFLLSGHVVIFMLAALAGLILGWLSLVRGRVPNSYFWILAVVALAASLVELLTDLGWLAEKAMRKTPLLPKRMAAEKASMLLGALIGIGIWFLTFHPW